MIENRPYSSVEALLNQSDMATQQLSKAGLLEGFSGHPRIGERKAHSTWSSSEQSGVDQSAVSLMQELEQANLKYEEKFDHVFLICATGKSGEFMLSECKRRLSNSAEVEIEEAREQLKLINAIRINKLLEEV